MKHVKPEYRANMLECSEPGELRRHRIQATDCMAEDSGLISFKDRSFLHSAHTGFGDTQDFVFGSKAAVLI
jgi:hypothetical protein